MNKEITVAELTQRIESGENLQLIDVRTPGEFASGHIPGAVSIPMEQAEARLQDFRTGVPAVLICQSGNRATVTCSLLESRHPELLVLQGGTSAWREAGLPTVCTTATRWSLERQVRLGAGLLVLTGTLLSVTLHPTWVYLAMFVGAGLTFAGATNICGMASLLAMMPWNQPRKSPVASAPRSA